MAKKKVFFIVSSLTAGGSERVFWLLSQGFDKSIFKVYIVLFDSRNNRFSDQLADVEVIDLKTIRASKSFFKLYDLIKKEKPYAVFSTAAHLNILVSLISFFTKIPYMIGRESNIYNQMAKFGGLRSRFWGMFVNFFYRRFDTIVCQSKEMEESFLHEFAINKNKLVVIPNPVIIPENDESVTPQAEKKVLIVARLAPEKGHKRLLDIFASMPHDLYLTIAGDGPLKQEIENQIKTLGIQNRVSLPGHIYNINGLLGQHSVFVLTSYTEGFPNAVLEALAMGIPVVAFMVGGLTELIKPGFNGYIVEQGNIDQFKFYLMKACNKTWDVKAIRQDIEERFSIAKVTRQYESLIVE
jgi:glycosyltransferase involved in cell wall biosynthesis